MGMNNFVLNANDIILLIVNNVCSSHLMLNNKSFLKLTHMEFVYIFQNFFFNCFGPVSRVVCLLLPKFPYTEFALIENLRRLLIRSDHFGVHVRLGKAL